ncbi:MAG TPA: chemotaxis protein CheW [Polyangiaceae bacterium]|jgi:purine-binding chemotaxis protein CheW
MTTLARYEQRPLAVGESASARGELHVAFKVSDTEYALSAETVLQMESYAGATAVPGAAPYIAGIVQIRGKIVPIVDLRVRFGGTPTPIVLDNRVIVGQQGDRIVGLLVDSAREVVRIAPSQIEPPPQIVGQQAQGFVKAVAKLGERLVMLIDFGKVIGEERVDVSV